MIQLVHDFDHLNGQLNGWLHRSRPATGASQEAALRTQRLACIAVAVHGAAASRRGGGRIGAASGLIGAGVANRPIAKTSAGGAAGPIAAGVGRQGCWQGGPTGGRAGSQARSRRSRTRRRRRASVRRIGGQFRRPRIIQVVAVARQRLIGAAGGDGRGGAGGVRGWRGCCRAVRGGFGG